MERLGKRAGALNVDLMSNHPGEGRCDRLCSGVVLEKRWKMFESRAAQVVLILLLSTGEARGMNSLPDVQCGCLDLCEGCSNWLCICFELYCLIVGEIFSSLPS